MKVLLLIRKASLALLIVLLTVFLNACGGSDGSDDFDSVTAGLFTLKQPEPGSNNVEYCGSAHLEGNILVRPYLWHLDDMGITVQWENMTTGLIGIADQGTIPCSDGTLCSRYWHASVPLILGDNEIIVTALDQDGRTESFSVNITKPENTYYVSGKVVNRNGIGIDFTSGTAIYMRLIGEGREESNITSNGGSYGFACVRNGTYTLTPDSTIMHFSFEPESRVLNVDGANLSDIDFVTAEAYFITGNIRRENETGVSSVYVHLSNDDISVDSWYTDDEGYYEFAVPNGTYTLTPKNSWSTSLSFYPPDVVLTINGNDAPDVNFTATY